MHKHVLMLKDGPVCYQQSAERHRIQRTIEYWSYELGPEMQADGAERDNISTTVL